MDRCHDGRLYSQVDLEKWATIVLLAGGGLGTGEIVRRTDRATHRGVQATVIA